jgi:lipopolysaccharide export system protein LptA
MRHPDSRSRIRQAFVALGLAAALLPAVSRALTSDRNQPMKISADQVTIDDKAGRSVYTGHVVVVQGTLRVAADRLVVYTDKHHALQRLVATGRPVTYKQRPDGKQHDVHAKAARMEYFASRDQVVLTKDAQLRQGGNVFNSQRIVYNIKRDQVEAGKKAGGGRVEIVIQPQSKQPAGKP